MISYIFIVNVDVEAVLENGSGYIAFDAAAPEWKGKTFLGVMFRFDRSKCLPRLTRFVVTPKADFLFSPPTSPAPVPRAVCLSPITQCNLNCIHCISRHSRKTANQLTDDIWGRIERHVADNKFSTY
jgi:sulfatase maturation enzyme AslB (radical SAM superfamily)